MLSHADADRAMNLVRSRYGAHYQKGLDSMSAETVFVFLDLPAFTTKFAVTYNGCFKTANNFTETAQELVDYVNAFVAADLYNFQRKIYVKKDPSLGWGTLVHEYIHYLSHPSFYPKFYSIGGANPDIVEGFTEYLTRSADLELFKVRTSYESQYQKTRSWVESGRGNYDRLLATLFGGAASPLAMLV